MCVQIARLLCRNVISCQLLRPTQRQTMTTSSNTSVCAPNPKVLTTLDHTSLLADKRREICMDKLRKFAIVTLPKMKSKHNPTPASVLIALCLERDTNEISLLYTRRSRHLRSHRLQISFPGGKRDHTDASFVDCALRETEEEIGLPRQRVKIWGEGSPINLPRTATIVPVVGVVEDFHVSQLKLNLDEVEEAFSIPLNTLLSPTTLRHTQFRTGYSGPVFVVGQQHIWGITGYLTVMFLRCLLPSNNLSDALKSNPNFVRPYKLPPKPAHS